MVIRSGRFSLVCFVKSVGEMLQYLLAKIWNEGIGLSL